MWGLAAIIRYLAAECFAVFAILDSLSTTAVLMHLPLAVQEMVLAVWLVVKGFNLSALATVSHPSLTRRAPPEAVEPAGPHFVDECAILLDEDSREFA